VKHLIRPNDIALVASEIGRSTSRSIGILTGFPCIQDDPPTENDGVPGSVLLGIALAKMGKRVQFFTDACNEHVISQTLKEGQRLAHLSAETFIGDRMQLHCVDSLHDWFDDGLDEVPKDLSAAILANPRMHSLVRACSSLDCLVAVERASPTFDGHPKTMKGRSMTGLVSPLHWMFPMAADPLVGRRARPAGEAKPGSPTNEKHDAISTSVSAGSSFGGSKREGIHLSDASVLALDE